MNLPADAPCSAAAAGRWQPHLPAGPVEVLLWQVGEAPPLELQLLAQVFEESRRRGAEQLRCRPLRASPGEAPVKGLAVLAQAPDPAWNPWPLLEHGHAVAFVGAAARWFAGQPQARGQRVAMHWEDAGACEQLADEVVPSPSIVEVSGRWTTCSGGLAAIDLGLLIVQELAGSGIALQVMDALCIDRLREPGSRQRSAAAGVLAAMVPPLAEAVALMEANVEEPLPADELARLVGLSRRQLERLFKQHLGTVPSRYYLDIRLQRARKLLRETRHSLLQVALMCGFSSGSHFSTTYSSIFGIAPREERQRMMLSIAR